MEIYKYKIDQVSKKDRFDFVFMGDLHIGSIGFNREYFEEMIRWLMTQDTYRVFGMGDYIENTPVNHKHFDFEHLDRDMMLPEEQYAYALEWLSKIDDKIVGLIDGEHDQRTVPLTGHAWTRALCHELDVPYLSETGLVRVQFSRINEKRSWDFYLTHGRCGGKGGAAVNKLTDLAAHWGADVYAMGGTHQLKTWPELYHYLNNKSNFEERKRYFLLTGSYLKSYEVGKKGYAEPKQWKPLVTGSPKVKLYPSRNDIHASE